MTDTEHQTLSQRVKAGTWDLHERAEHDTLPQHMARGSMPREAFVEMLGQQYLAQSALDERIRAERPNCPALANLIDDEQLQGPHLARDLAHWGVDASTIEPRSGSTALIERVERTNDPFELLGLHYVREGANNGNRFIAMKLRKTWDLPMGQADGFSYLDPYGAEQRPRWEKFKQTLDAQDMTEDQRATVIAAARDMFELIMAMHHDHDLPPIESGDQHTEATHGQPAGHH
tara:strand:- start:4 stop:699 length:696 start_codon:yes stop_codon:yes gene_type:complete